MNTSATLVQAAAAPAEVIEFGSFRYEPLRRRLSDAQGPCRIGSRALELLGVLLETPGRFYSRGELEARVWPRSVVEETSLRVHVSALRRVLGDSGGSAKYIANMPGRGYAFVAPVRALGGPLAQPALPRGHVAPARGVIGRDAVIARLGELSARQRLVSVVGPGGVGKTAAALCVAHSHHDGRGIGVADFGGVTDAALVATELGRACGVAVPGDHPVPALERALQHRQLLIVLDNCEHLVEAVAALVARLMRSCPQLRFIATSLEPLDVEGEWVFMLPPLALPSGHHACADELMGSPAVQLFVERARSACDSFELTEHNAAAVAKLCVLLDGMPLAIELAAALAASAGVHALAARENELLGLLTRGRRTAPPRHRTLRALLSWGHALLSSSEQRMLQRLTAFPGGFGLADVLALPEVSEAGHGPLQAMHDVLGLCAKSMLMCESQEGGDPRYRLLHAVRLFAAQRAVS